MIPRFPAHRLAWCLVLCALTLGAVLGRGAQPYQPVFGDPLRERWRWRSFLELSGLDVQCMAEGADGTMWFGTANGLWSYDGFDWVFHTDGVGRIVTALCGRPDGAMFAGGDWGISRFADGRWTKLLTPSRDRIRTIDDALVKKLVVARDGSLWAATLHGVFHLQDSVWTLYTDAENAARVRADPKLAEIAIELLPGEVTGGGEGAAPDAARGLEISEIFADGQGRVWMGTRSGRVFHHDPARAASDRGGWSLHGASVGVLPGEVTSIAQMTDGAIWVVHADAEEANVFDGRAWRTVKLPLSLPPLDVGDAGGRVLPTRDGVVWLSARYLLCAYRDGQWLKYGPPDLPYPSTRNVVIQSADGALWFAGANSEIHRVDYQTSRWTTLEDLNFQWESPTGAQWFLHRRGRVVRHDRGTWTSFGAEDGLIDTPVALLGTRRGGLWAAGSHERTAATARFDGERWKLEVHPNFSFAVDWRAVFESADGSVWFGSLVDTDGPEQYRYGILQFREGTWIHHRQARPGAGEAAGEDPTTQLPPSTNPDQPIEKYICFGESRDGTIWAGRNILVSRTSAGWRLSPPVVSLPRIIIESMLTTRAGDLWIGTREAGALRFDGREWRRFGVAEGLVANSIRSIAETSDDSIWAVTDRGSSRFDGHTWMEDVLPEALNFSHESGNLKTSASGKLWINHYTLYWMRRAWTKSPPPEPDAEFRTVCREFRGAAPRTTINAGTRVISQPGNMAVLWSGAMPWRNPKEARLQFSFRLDGGPWSPFTAERGHSFFTLPSGEHRLEVRSRDADFNVDPTPAAFDFVVLPPVWRQAWFLALMTVLGGLVVAQSIRVVLEQGRLRRAHDELDVRVRQRTAELETANRDLAAANRELEAFSYSVSHDLRAPLRSIDGFSKALLEDYAAKLDDEGRDDLRRVRAAAQRMGQLIDDLLKLSRVTRSEVRRAPVNLSALAGEILRSLAERDPARKVRVAIAPGLVVQGDGSLLQIALENLLGNAWKFTSRRAEASIEFGVTLADEPVFFVRDDGAGFDMAHAPNLFGPFQRLHTDSEFPGMGIGLAIVQRIVLRHGGRVWAEGVPDRGAVFSFTLGRQDVAPGGDVRETPSA